MMRPILSAKRIWKSFSHPFPVDVLKGISLDLYAGESIAIIGSSGEGKSTLLHILGTLDEPTSGEMSLAGHPVSLAEAPKLRNRHMGFIFQSCNLLDDYTVLQNVLMPPLIAGQPIHKQSSAYQRAQALLERVGLSHRTTFTAKLLSGGEKQRVALARALINDPEIILADEPSGNLDHKTSERIHELLVQSVKEFNKSLIVVTHDRELARLCDYNLILCDGQLLREE